VFQSNQELLTGLLAEASRGGEIVGADPEGLARLLLAVVNGSLLTWAVYREGEARGWLARDVDLALEPYRPASR